MLFRQLLLAVGICALVALTSGVLGPRPGPASAAGIPSDRVDAGAEHTCAVTGAGGVKCWGANFTGQLGDGTTTNSITPVDVCATGVVTTCSETAGNLLRDVTTITAAGVGHTCVLTSASGVKCWGSNDRGKLGIGSSDSDPHPIPVDVCATGATAPCNEARRNLLGGVTSVAAGRLHTCAIVTGDQVKCWGSNENSQLGTTTTEICASGADCSTTPVFVCNTGALLPCDGDILSGVADIDAGALHSCALTSAGGVKCWGSNSQGALGDVQNCGTVVCTTPVDVCAGGVLDPCGSFLTDATAISTGSAHTCAIVTGSRVKCWGDNRDGQLGDGTIGFVPGFTSTPVDVCAVGKVGSCGSNLLNGVTALATGDGHTCALAAGAGVVTCWGDNGNGQLGIGSSDFDPHLTPEGVTGFSSEVTAISAGAQGAHTCALLTAGGIACWGLNHQGQLGSPTTETCFAGDCSTTPLAVGLAGTETVIFTPCCGSQVVDFGGGALTENGVTVTFSNVQAAGETSVTLSDVGPKVLSGFRLGTETKYFNISTDAIFKGTVTVCVNYAPLHPGKDFSTGPDGELALTLQHYNTKLIPPMWEIVNVVRTRFDLNRDRICSRPLNNLSPFIIAQPIASVGGLVVDLGEAGTPLEAPDSASPNASVLTGVAAAVLAGTLALGGAAWYTRRRWVR